MGGVHQLDKLCVDLLGEVRVLFKRRTQLFQVQIVHIRHDGNTMGVAHADAADLPGPARCGQGHIHQLRFPHLHRRQVSGQQAVLAHLYLPHPLSLPAQGLESAAGIDAQFIQHRTFRRMGAQPLGHTADAVAAHLPLAAVGVEHPHLAMGTRRLRGADADDAVRTNGKMPLGQPAGQLCDLLRHTALAAVQIDIVVGAALHFSKRKLHSINPFPADAENLCSYHNRPGTSVKPHLLQKLFRPLQKSGRAK